MLVGSRLKELRQARNMSAEDLAKELGISVSQVFRYESEKVDASSSVVKRLSEYFDVSTDYLLGLEDSTARHLIPKFMETEGALDLLLAWGVGDYSTVLELLLKAIGGKTTRELDLLKVLHERRIKLESELPSDTDSL